MPDDKIVVTNTAIIINNYEMNDCKKIENYFKIFDPITHSYYYIGMHYDEKEKRLYLPRGLDIWFVEKAIGEPANILTNQCDPYFVYDDVMVSRLPRNEVQKTALRFMLGKGEYRNNLYKSQLAVNLYMGKGKTYLTIATMSYLGIRGVVIASTSEWLHQWKNEILNTTDFNEKQVCILEGSTSIHRLTRMTKKQLDKYRIFLITHSLLRSYASEQGWNAIGDLFKFLGIGIKVYDEAHLDYGNICMIDYYTNTYKTYYLTASPGKSNDKENQIYQMSFKNVPSIDLFDENTDPHTSYVAMFFSSRPDPVQISKCKNKYGLNRMAYIDYVVHQPQFNKLVTILMDLCSRLAPMPEDKILIYIGTNNAISVVYEFLVNNYPEFTNNIGIYTSVVSSEDKKTARNKKIILSTTKSAGAALDLKGLKVTINLAEPYKSEIIAKQSIGRTRDDNTFYIDIIDVGFEQCRRFYYKKLPVFQKYAKDCSTIKLSVSEIDTRYDKIIQQRMAAHTSKLTLFSHIEKKPRLFSKV